MAQTLKENGHLIGIGTVVDTWMEPFVMTERKPFLANRIFDEFTKLVEFVNNTTQTGGEGNDAIDGLTLSVVNDPDKSKNGLYYVVQASGDGGNYTKNNYIIQRVITSNFSNGIGSGASGNTNSANSMVSPGNETVTDINLSYTSYENKSYVVTGIYIDSNGSITYSYSGIFDENTHHSTHLTTNASDLQAGTDGIINAVYLDTYGCLHFKRTDPYVYTGIIDPSANLLGECAIGYEDSTGMQLVNGIKVSKDGKLSYTYIRIVHGSPGSSATGTFGLEATKTYTLDQAKFYVPEFTVNTQGHITSAAERIVTITHPTTYIAQNTFKDNANITITNGGTVYIPQWKTNTYGHMSAYQVDTFTLSHGNPNSYIGTYGLEATKAYTLDSAKFYIPEFTVNAQGHITYAAERTVTITHPKTYTAQNTFLDNSNISITTGGSFKIPQWKTNTYGHMSAYQVDTVTLSHGNSGVTSGNYGSELNTTDNSFNIPKLTVSAQGHITSASNQKITLPTLTTSLFTGDNGVTYMLTISNGSIKIDQPIKRIYTTANPTPSSPTTTITYSDNYVGSSYSITSASFGYTGVGDEKITIEFNGSVPTGTTVSITNYTHNTHFTYEANGENLIITLKSGKVRTVSRSIPTSGTFGFGNVSASTSVASKSFTVSVNIGGNNINLSTSLASNTSSRTVTPKCNYYISYIVDGDTKTTIIPTLVDCSSSTSGRPSKLEIKNGGEDLKFIFPSGWGTPKFYQMNAQILDWKPQNPATQSISTKAYDGTTNKQTYKVYCFGKTKAGLWNITW